MSLNLSRKPNIKYYSSDRLAQYLGNGSCIFVDIHTKLNELFNDNEVIFYDSQDLEDFGKKIDYFSNNHSKVKQIAKKGWEKGHSYFNEKAVTNYFIDIAVNSNPTSDYGWPIHLFKK